MTLFQKIRLSGRFGAAVYAVSGVVTAAACALTVYEPEAFPTCLALKLFSIPAVLYIHILLEKGMTMYFYINLGISRREYRLIPLMVEFAAFLILLTLSALTGYALR